MAIIFIISGLVVLNFLLLKFSCNKTTKKEMEVVKPLKQPKVVSNQLESHQLASTGS